MLTLPQDMMKVILPFAALFSETVWDYAQILLMGAILAPGKRTVSAALTVVGLPNTKITTAFSTGRVGVA